MTQKNTFRKSFERTISAISTVYVPVINLENLVHPVVSDVPIVQVLQSGDLSTPDSSVIIIDTTILVYRESNVSFSGATRCTLAIAQWPVMGFDDGYMVSRQVSCTHLPCAPTWSVWWHFNGNYGRQAMIPDTHTGFPSNTIEFSISQSDAGSHKYFGISEISIYETS